MQTLWFALAALTVAIYVVMDGFDFGAGVLHLWVARTDSERRQVIGAIGPFWDGNEVWLLAAGGVLFLAFPKVLASGLSGFYLAIMLVLWVLIIRGISIEFRSHLADGMWHSFWDAGFALASTLAPVLFGAALGNLIRGVPLNERGWFSLSLFESFSPFGVLGILDWYTVLAGVFALVAIAHHGALFLIWKTEGDLRERCLRIAAGTYPAVVLLWLITTAATWMIAPDVFVNLSSRPLAWIATVVFLSGLVTAFVARRAGRDVLAFVASAIFLLGVLAATAACLYPTMIRATTDPAWSLTAFNASASHESLVAGILWWPIGILLVFVYFVILFRLHGGKSHGNYGQSH